MKILALTLLMINIGGCATFERTMRTTYSHAVNEAVREINNIDDATLRRGVANTVGVVCSSCVGHTRY